MFQRISDGRICGALVILRVALFLALGRSSYAALSIGSGQFRDNSVQSADIHNNSVRGKDIRNRPIKGRDVGQHALTGADVAEAKLGKVPSAAQADHGGVRERDRRQLGNEPEGEERLGHRCRRRTQGRQQHGRLRVGDRAQVQDGAR